MPDLEFGLDAFDDFDTNLNQDRLWRSIVPQSELSCEDYVGTMYEAAYLEKKMVFTHDFKKSKKNKAVEAFLKMGIRSHVVVPLTIEEEVVGMIEFASPRPGWLSFVNVKRFQDLSGQSNNNAVNTNGNQTERTVNDFAGYIDFTINYFISNDRIGYQNGGNKYDGRHDIDIVHVNGII